MKLAQLMSIYPQLKFGQHRMSDVSKLTSDSRQVVPGSIYVAIRGTAVDGHEFIEKAVENGAIGLVVENEDSIPQNYPGAIVLVNDSREALNRLADHFYQRPSSQLFCIGVTGTNGKTSVCYMIETILTHFGWKTGVLGTIDHHLGDRQWNSQLTTPDPITLHQRLYEFLQLGAKAVAFEVSSHALKQKRADSIPFDCVVFTNLSQDHLDYHNTMEEYQLAKQRLFNDIPLLHTQQKTTAILNREDAFGAQIHTAGHVRTLYYGQTQGDLQFRILQRQFSGTQISVHAPNDQHEFFLPLAGDYNVYNAIAAIGVGLSAGASLQTCCDALTSFKGVPGRLQYIEHQKDFHVFVDYAHTEDALFSVLQTLNTVRQNTTSPSRIITVFGCGGDRDRDKRQKMGVVAVKNSDLTFITSDNPRSESPEKIISDIKTNVPQELFNESVFEEVDRKSAIHRALQMAQKNDVILIAGKGHENYQIIGDQVISFDDAEVVKELLA